MPLDKDDPKDSNKDKESGKSEEDSTESSASCSTRKTSDNLEESEVKDTSLVSSTESSGKTQAADDPKEKAVDTEMSGSSVENPSLVFSTESSGKTQAADNPKEKAADTEMSGSDQSTVHKKGKITRPFELYAEFNRHLSENLSRFTLGDGLPAELRSIRDLRTVPHFVSPKYTAVGLKEPSQSSDERYFEIYVDVSGYEKRNVSWTVKDGKIDLYAKQNLENDFGYQNCELHQVFHIPKDVDKEKLVANIAEDGRLTIKAPRFGR